MIDGGCFVGQPMDGSAPFTAADLLRSMDRFGVQRAVVGSYRCLYQDIRAGNLEIAGLARKHPDRIFPLGILHHGHYGESPAQSMEWLATVLGFKAVGFFSAPAYYPAVWTGPMMGEVADAAERLNLVMQVGIRNEEELNAVAAGWGGRSFPVLVRWTGAHRYRLFAHEAAVARSHANFCFDVGNACSTGAITFLARTIGASRLFFASNQPYHLPAPPHAVLHEADLSGADRQSIEAMTLAGLLDLSLATPRPPRAPWLGDWDELVKQPKFDTHWHPDHWNLGEPETSLESQQQVFTRFHADRVLGFSVLAINYDLTAGNQLTADWLGRDARFRGLIVVNPLQLEASFKEIEKWSSQRQFVGLKTIQDNYGLGLDDPLYEPLLAEAEKRRLPVLAHLTGMEGAARRHPNVKFIAAHGNWGRLRRLADVPNVWFDFSTSHAFAEETQLARFIRAVGPERVLFGSDGQLVSPAWSLAKLLGCGLSADELGLIFRGNAERLFTRQPR